MAARVECGGPREDSNLLVPMQVAQPGTARQLSSPGRHHSPWAARAFSRRRGRLRETLQLAHQHGSSRNGTAVIMGWHFPITADNIYLN